MRRDINSLFGQIASLTRQACGREMAHALVKKKGKPKDKYYGKLILDLGNEVRSSVEEGATAMKNLVRKLGNAEERAECKKLKKELEDARGVVFEERPNEAIDVPFEEKSPLSEPIMPPKFAPMTQAAVQRMIKESVGATIAAERARQANVRNNSNGYGQARGQVTVPVVRECTFAGFMKCNPDNFCGTERAVELRRWFEKTEMTFGISECAEDKKVKFAIAILRGPALTWWNSKVAILGLDVANQMGWTKMKKLIIAEFCHAEELQRMENELWNLKVKEYNMVAYTQIFNELALMCPRMVTYSKPTNLNEAWENFQSGNNSGKSNHKDNSRQSSQNNQKQGNARAMTTAPNEGKVSFGPLPKVKQEEVGEARGQAYAIKDAEPQGPIVVTGTFLLNNHYAFVLFDSGSDRSFVDTRFSSMLDIDPVKIDTSYEVELVDGRIVSTNTILKGCTLNLVNHLFEIDLMPIELGTFDVIIGMDWLVKHDAVIVCDEKVVHIPYGNKTLTVEKETEGEAIEDVPVIRDFPKAFSDELTGLPPPRQVEFRIDLVPRATPVARALYRLALSKMRELLEQLRELLEKGFIRPSSSPWGAPVLFVK
ncbi:putative reverse transcriptase domain-containing protein, partial [Tanacetum coccineum]